MDIGCGYGAVGIVAAALNPKLQVVMTDVNVRAVRLARKNLELKQNIATLKYDMATFMNQLKIQFSIAFLSNPPVSAGMETVKAIVKQAPKVMADKATFQMVIRSKIGIKTLPDLFGETFGNVNVLARGSGFRVLIGQRIGCN